MGGDQCSSTAPYLSSALHCSIFAKLIFLIMQSNIKDFNKFCLQLQYNNTHNPFHSTLVMCRVTNTLKEWTTKLGKSNSQKAHNTPKKSTCLETIKSICHQVADYTRIPSPVCHLRRPSTHEDAGVFVRSKKDR